MRVWTNGCFDLLHIGHVKFLRRCAQFGELFVFLNSDESIKELKGDNRPIITFEDRKEMILAVVPGSVVWEFEDVTPIALWDSIQSRDLPDIYVKEASSARSAEVSYLQARGVMTAFVKRTSGISTTEIIQKCQPVQPSSIVTAPSSMTEAPPSVQEMLNSSQALSQS